MLSLGVDLTFFEIGTLRLFVRILTCIQTANIALTWGCRLFLFQFIYLAIRVNKLAEMVPVSGCSLFTRDVDLKIFVMMVLCKDRNRSIKLTLVQFEGVLRIMFTSWVCTFQTGQVIFSFFFKKRKLLTAKYCTLETICNLHQSCLWRFPFQQN